MCHQCSQENRQELPQKVFCAKKVLFKFFGKFTGKQLCRSFFFNKVAEWKNTFFIAQLRDITSKQRRV